MKMTVVERLVVLSILPKEGDYSTLKILRDLRMNLGFTEDEFKNWGIANDPESGMINWETNGEAEIPIGEKATDIIGDALKRLNKEQKLGEHMFDVYERFIPTTE